MPDSRPRIVFNNKGICNACLNIEKKNNIDWKKREEEFLKLVRYIKDNSSKNNSYYDCLVPWSGGKDSTSIALKLKKEYSLNPLLVTFSPLISNECGIHNRNELLKLGFDSIFINPNIDIARKLARRFFIERGNPKVAWDAGVNAGPINVALKFNISTVFYAEHGESEYGGKIIKENSDKIRDFEEVLENQIGDDPSNWIDDKVSVNDLNPYKYPDEKILINSEIKAYYFSYFFKSFISTKVIILY